MRASFAARVLAFMMAVAFACSGFVARGALGVVDTFFASMLTAVALLSDDDDDDDEGEHEDDDECEAPA